MTKTNTDKYQVEASELLFRSMTENSADIIIRQDADGKIIYITPSVFITTGYTQDEMLGKHLAEFTCDEGRASMDAAYASILDCPSQPARHEFQLRHKDGHVLWMESTMVNLLAVPGVVSVIVNMRDVTFRKEAEEKIYISELKFRSLIENTHDGMTLMDADFKMRYLSSAVLRIMGFTPEELVNTDPRELSHPDDLEPVGKIMQALFPRFGGTATAEYRLRHKNGEWIWLRSNITNLLHVEHINAFVFNYEDITERKKAEEVIRQSERMMAAAEKMAHFGSWETDIVVGGFGELRWSEEVYRLFGYTPWSVEVTTERFYDSVHPEDRNAVFQALVNAMAESRRYSIDHRVVWPDGSVRWVHEDAEFVVDEITGRAVKVFGTVQDITERKEAEDKLLKSEANLKAIFDNTEIGYAMLDESWKVVTFNPRASAWISSVHHETLNAGDVFLSYIKDAAEAARLKVLFKKVMEGESFVFDHNTSSRDKNEKWYTVRMNPIIGDSNKKVHGICIAIGDVTFRKQHEFEREKITNDLIQRNKDLEQFTYVVSHNLRAPLTNIIGLLQLLSEDGQTLENQQFYNKQLSISVKKMDSIIKDLNYVLQIKKELSEVKEVVQFEELVDDIKLSIENIILQENVALITDFTQVGELLTVKSYLYSIFYNLILNSIKYRQPGISPVIEITGSINENRIELVFNDNGLGIDLKRKGSEVFGLYKRFHYHIEGKGMGLFMTKTQVETLGGTIRVESAVNKGAKFTITFPLG